MIPTDEELAQKTRPVGQWLSERIASWLVLIAVFFAVFLFCLFEEESILNWFGALSGWVIGVGALLFARKQVLIMDQQREIMEKQTAITKEQNRNAKRQNSIIQKQASFIDKKQMISEIQKKNEVLEKIFYELRTMHQYNDDEFIKNFSSFNPMQAIPYFITLEDEIRIKLFDTVKNTTDLPNIEKRQICNACVDFDMDRIENEIDQLKNVCRAHVAIKETAAHLRKHCIIRASLAARSIHHTNTLRIRECQQWIDEYRSTM